MYLTAVQTTAQTIALLGFVQMATAQIAPVPPLPPVPSPEAQTQTQTQTPPQTETRAQTPAPQRTTPGNGAPAAAESALPPDYVIGPEDVLSVLFWRDKEMSGDYVVRPDGQITLPLLSDVRAAGLTPEQLRASLTQAASKYLEDPNVTVGVKAINSRKVFITGMVGKVGSYPLTAPTTVLQLITMAGGLQEFAKSKEIVVLRDGGGKPSVFKFNYNDVKKGKNLQQNILLKPGDTVIVP